jgi:hypothetical protein
MTPKPRHRLTQLDITQARLNVAMDALATISQMKPKSLAVLHARSVHAFLVFCCQNDQAQRPALGGK